MSKKSGILAILTTLTLALILNACQKNEITTPFITKAVNNPNGFTISGDGLTSHLVFFNQTSGNGGYYDTTKHATFINIKGDTDSIQTVLIIKYPGAGTTLNPNISLDTLISSDSTISLKIVRNTLNAQYNAVTRKTFFRISKYDPVGDKIAGSFYGSFINQANSNDTVVISDGRFSVQRLPDVH